MSLITILLAVTLAISCKQGDAVAIRVGKYAGTAVAPLTAFEKKVIDTMVAGKYTITEVTLASAQERIDCLTGGTARFPTPGCDAVISRFTVTAERQALVTFLAPYYYGDGAGLKARTSATAKLVKASTNPAIAYAPYVTAQTITCIQTGSAYIPAAQALGLNLSIKPDSASIVADTTCALMITDSVAEFPPFIKVKGPLLANTAAPWGVAVQLKKTPQTAAQKTIRANLEESAVALYQGTPGSTPLETFNAGLVTAGLTSGSNAIKNGALFINKFFY